MTHTANLTGCRLVSLDGAVLPLRSTELHAEAGAGIARTRLVQRFENPESVPLEVTYTLPLPADGAVSGFAFTLSGQRFEGVVQKKEDARRTFEDAILEGRTAAILEEERSSVFRQTLGNLAPGAIVEIEVVVDQPLIWESGGWTWRFPTVVAPRYLGEGTPDPAAVTVDIANHAGPSCKARLRIVDAVVGPPASPSHGLLGAGEDLRLEGTLDRDVVVRWPVAASTAGISVRASASEHGCYGLVTLVPPRSAGRPVPRDMIVLLDTSGSMGGAPLAQAVGVVRSLITALGPRDQLELIEFSTASRRWQRQPVAATESEKRKAIAWLEALRAGGGTQMHDGIVEALGPLRSEAQRQVVLVTDGLIGHEALILRSIRESLPAGSSLHTVGIGHGVNRTLTEGAARAGGGVEVICAPGEAYGSAAKTLLERCDSPQIIALELGGSAFESTLITRIPDLYAGAPVRVPVKLKGPGEVTVRGRTADGSWTATAVAETADDGGVVALAGRAQVADLELRRTEGEMIDAQIEALGIAFQISTRLTSWVAVSGEATVESTAPVKAVTQPGVLAAGLRPMGVGLHNERGGQFRSAAAPGRRSRSKRKREARPDGFADRGPPQDRSVSWEDLDDEEAFAVQELSSPASTAPPVPPKQAPAAPDIEQTRRPGWNVSVASIRDTRLVLKLLGTGALPGWVTVMVRFRRADGTEFTTECGVERARSTVATWLQLGQQARLVITLPPGVGTPIGVVLDGTDHTL